MRTGEQLRRIAKYTRLLINERGDTEWSDDERATVTEIYERLRDTLYSTAPTDSSEETGSSEEAE